MNYLCRKKRSAFTDLYRLYKYCYVLRGNGMIKYLAVFVLLVPCLLYAGDLPNNTHQKAYGSGWACNRGYYKVGEKCKKVIMPDNASLNIYGNGWTCNRGYYKLGKKCEKVVIPENAGLNVYGNGWACNQGYKTVNNGCIPMTSEEIERQRASGLLP